jgi:Flp pilus assembly protein TadG
MNNMGRHGLKHSYRKWFRVLARRGGFRGDRGSALVEFALVLSFFAMPMLLGTAEMATLIYASIEVSNAAHAGAMYGMMSSTFAGNSAQIIGAAQAEASDFGANLVVTPTSYFACSAALGGTRYTSQTAANTACSGAGNHSLQFIQVAASVPVVLPFRCPGIPSTITLNSSSIMEVEE